MASGSSTTTTFDDDHIAETQQGESVFVGDWLGWQRDVSLGQRNHESVCRFGKVVEHSGEYFIICVPKNISKAVLPDKWDFEEFSWAVAEGRVIADSIWVLDDKLANHEMVYAQYCFE